MKVVLPVLYCPSNSTEGFASKSDSVNNEEKKLPNLYASSSGLICSIATCILMNTFTAQMGYNASGNRIHTLLHVVSCGVARSDHLPDEKGERGGGGGGGRCLQLSLVSHPWVSSVLLPALTLVAGYV